MADLGTGQRNVQIASNLPQTANRNILSNIHRKMEMVLSKLIYRVNFLLIKKLRNQRTGSREYHQEKPKNPTIGSQEFLSKKKHRLSRQRKRRMDFRRLKHHRPPRERKRRTDFPKRKHQILTNQMKQSRICDFYAAILVIGLRIAEHWTILNNNPFKKELNSPRI